MMRALALHHLDISEDKRKTRKNPVQGAGGAGSHVWEAQTADGSMLISIEDSLPVDPLDS